MATPTGIETSMSVLPSREDLLRAYRAMYTARRLDDREILLKRQNRIFFQISGAGHEAVQVAAGMVLAPGARLVLSLLSRPRAVPHAGRDAARDAAGRPWARPPIPPPAGGRCRRTGATRELHIVSASSPTGTQFLQAVGCAEAVPLPRSRVRRSHAGLAAAKAPPAKANSGRR